MKKYILQCLHTWRETVRNRRLSIIIGFAAFASIGIASYVFINYRTQTAPLSKPPEEIKGKLVVLKQLKEDYFIDYHNAFSPTVRKYLEFPEFITLGYTISYLQDQLKLSTSGRILLYCIFDKETDKLIGEVEVRDKDVCDLGQFGWWINESFWGKGHAQEAIRMITNIYFRLKPNETSYVAHVRLWNKRSYHAMKKFGLTDVGYFYENGKATRYILEYKNKR